MKIRYITIFILSFIVAASPVLAQTDNDGDGFDAEVNDCNDNDAEINPNTQWYVDDDGDGLGDPNPGLIVTQCLQPQTAVYVLNGLDPDDSTVDFDNDGLNDGVEVLELGTDPDDDDSDADGLKDGLEIDVYATDPLNTDSDNDGLNDGDEVNIHGTEPDNEDTDNDDLSDGDEISEGTDPLDKDSDDDDLEDGDEVNSIGSNPLDADSDDELLEDGDEVMLYGTEPLDADTDNDGLSDYEEVITFGTEPTSADIDNDGLTDPEEVNLGTDSYRADTDQDGLDDKTESQNLLTDPLNADTDGDGCDDKIEVDDIAKDPLVAEFTTYYEDVDEDGFGDAAAVLANQSFCEIPDGYVTNQDDCDDSDADVFPDAPAKADGKDNNCDGTIDKLNQTITFDPIEDQIDGSTLSLTATTDSGLDVVYEVAGPATVSGNSLTFTDAGKVTVIAKQSGDDGYNPAADAEQEFCVNPIPAISTQPGGIYALTLESNYTQGNQWLLDGVSIENATEASYIVNEPGTYSLTVSVDGCSGASEDYLVSITSVEDDLTDNVEIFPNPFTNTLNLKMESLESNDAWITITDINGRVQSQFEFGTDFQREEQINTSDLRPGVYFLVIKSGNKVFQEKIVKQ